MPQLLIALAILYFGYRAIKWAANAPPSKFGRLIRVAGENKMIALRIFTMATKRGPTGFIVATLFKLWLESAKKASADFSPAGSGRSTRVSQTQSRKVWLELDLDSGAMRGRFIDGPNAGRALENFSHEDLVRAFHEDLGDDPEGRRLLAAYLDRMFPFWRNANEPHPTDSPMTRERACAILGIAPDASREIIAQAYRMRMKQAHPDNGGDSQQAIELNEARAILMKRFTG